MKILSVDTSHHKLSLTLLNEERTIRSSEPSRHQQAEKILPLITGLLEEAHLKPAQLDLFVYNRGPGSFTGIRVGAATLMALALATHKKCFGIPGDKTLCHAESDLQKKNLITLFGDKNFLYCTLFAKEGDGFCEREKLRRVTEEELMDCCQNFFPDILKVSIAGDISTSLIQKLGFYGEIEIYPSLDFYQATYVGKHHVNSSETQPHDFLYLASPLQS